MVNLAGKSHLTTERKDEMAKKHTKEKGKLITFEGIDCCGKGTQITKLMEYLVKNRVPIFDTHEPGGTDMGEALRALLKHPETAFAALRTAFAGKHEDFNATTWQKISIDRTPWTEIFMFLAARAEFIDKIVLPKISLGINVISDRLSDSTRAYQGGGHFYSRPDMIKAINRNNHFALQNLEPSLTFLLDISIEEMQKRAKLAGTKSDAYFEQLGPSFFERVRQEYLCIHEEEPKRVILIDGSQSKEEVFEEIKPHCDRLFNLNS